jgi:ABC-2 type transport system permease protein
VNKLIRSEWIKFHTLRMNWGLVVVALALDALMLGVGLFFFDRSLGDTAAAATGPEYRIGALLNPLGLMSNLLGVVAVMIMASEYRSKTVIPSLAAAPIRSEVVVAKAVIAAVVAGVVTIVALVVNVGVGLVVLDGKGYPVKLGDGHFVQAAGGAILYAMLAALFALGIGVLFQSSVLAITLVVAIPVVAEPALGGFMPDWISRYLPFAAGGALSTPGGTDQLSAWEGGAVLGLWAVGLLVVAGLVFERRDLGNTS